MNGFFKTLLAGYGAKKLGGGCFGTIIVFIIIYWILGYFQNVKLKNKPNNNFSINTSKAL